MSNDKRVRNPITNPEVFVVADGTSAEANLGYSNVEQVKSRLNISSIEIKDINSAQYTLLLSDNGKTLQITNTSSTTITLPNNFPVGYNVRITSLTTSSVTLSATGGAQVIGSNILQGADTVYVSQIQNNNSVYRQISSGQSLNLPESSIVSFTSLLPDSELEVILATALKVDAENYKAVVGIKRHNRLASQSISFEIIIRAGFSLKVNPITVEFQTEDTEVYIESNIFVGRLIGDKFIEVRSPNNSFSSVINAISDNDKNAFFLTPGLIQQIEQDSGFLPYTFTINRVPKNYAETEIVTTVITADFVLHRSPRVIFTFESNLFILAFSYDSSLGGNTRLGLVKGQRYKFNIINNFSFEIYSQSNGTIIYTASNFSPLHQEQIFIAPNETFGTYGYRFYPTNNGVADPGSIGDVDFGEPTVIPVDTVEWYVENPNPIIQGFDNAGLALSGTTSFANTDIQKQVTVNVPGNLIVEPDRAFQVKLRNPSAGGVISNSRAIGVIIDNDLSASVILSPPAFSVTLFNQVSISTIHLFKFFTYNQETYCVSFATTGFFPFTGRIIVGLSKITNTGIINITSTQFSSNAFLRTVDGFSEIILLADLSFSPANTLFIVLHTTTENWAFRYTFSTGSQFVEERLSEGRSPRNPLTVSLSNGGFHPIKYLRDNKWVVAEGNNSVIRQIGGTIIFSNRISSNITANSALYPNAKYISEYSAFTVVGSTCFAYVNAIQTNAQNYYVDLIDINTGEKFASITIPSPLTILIAEIMPNIFLGISETLFRIVRINSNQSVDILAFYNRRQAFAGRWAFVEYNNNHIFFGGSGIRNRDISVVKVTSNPFTFSQVGVITLPPLTDFNMAGIVYETAIFESFLYISDEIGIHRIDISSYT